MSRIPAVQRVNRAVQGYVRTIARDAILNDYLVFGDQSRLSIDATAIVNNAYFNLSSGRITVEAYASLAYSVSLITGTHDFDKINRQRQTTAPSEGRDIVIKQGAFVCSNAMVLGPCVVGEHSVVAAGSVVTHDVPPLTLVAGIPATVVGPVGPSEAILSTRGEDRDETRP
jgi:acetyltransferase-like isoleucine patch superfamily enzyme